MFASLVKFTTSHSIFLRPSLILSSHRQVSKTVYFLQNFPLEFCTHSYITHVYCMHCPIIETKVSKGASYRNINDIYIYTRIYIQSDYPVSSRCNFPGRAGIRSVKFTPQNTWSLNTTIANSATLRLYLRGYLSF
jgi:hypothetical protein